MKTKSDLNSKWWYRLIKVVYAGFFLICIITSVAIVIDENHPRQVSDYAVNCVATYTNHKNYFAQKDLSIYLFPYGSQTVYDSLSKSDKTAIRNACDISDKEASEATSQAMAYIDQQDKIGTTKEAIQSYIDENLRPYTISPTMRTEGSYTSVVLYALLSIIIVLMAAEVVRRIFYYIVLGTLRPTK